MDVLRPLFDWLLDHTYLVVFVGTLIDATGVPFPGRLLLAAAGALAARGEANVLMVIGLGALAATLVDQAWYLTITRGSNWLVDAYCRLRGRQRGCTGDADEYFRRYGSATIVLGRFFTVIRLVAWPMAAHNGVGYGRFLILDVLGATLWASIWVLLGWFVGEQWESVATSVGGWAAVVGGAVITALAAPFVLRYWRRRGRASLTPGPTESGAAASPGSPAVPPARPRP
jgi:membrane protein DedA with SNARE-associated domain